MDERMARNYPHPSGHRLRYHLASGFVSPGDTVLDAACGVGYGSEILVKDNSFPVTYVGVDYFESPEFKEFSDRQRSFKIANLNTFIPDFPFDICIGFETIEHIKDYKHYISMAKNARKWMLFSVPVVPTKHVNEFHLHDFTPGQLPGYVIDQDWALYQTLGQPSEVSEIYVFKRIK